jgi:hypothetical protein
MKRQKTIFASLVHPHAPEKEVCLLAESLRRNGGDWSGNPMWVMVPESLNRVSSQLAQELLLLDVQMMPYQISKEAMQFPYAHKAFAAAAAEEMAHGQCDILAMLDPDSVIVNQPEEFDLSPDTILGTSPVMLKWVGQSWGEPADGFWELIYQQCRTKPENIFPLTTTVDCREIKAYFNAGLLVVRPRVGLLRKWLDDFDPIYQSKQLQDYYQKNKLYAIFVHQAVLAGSILSLVNREQIKIFSESYNYPVMLYDKMTPEKSQARLDDMRTIRYDEFQTNPAWLEHFKMGPELRDWLTKKFSDSNI